jgi:antitoxin component of MazEF toxin-antitoxin module
MVAPAPTDDRLKEAMNAALLEVLLDDVTPENLHSEVETGSPRGDEAW